MALSDVEKEKDLTRRKKRPIVADTNLRWSDAQKLEAVQSWLVLGNMSLVSRILGIPRITLQTWRASAWWKEAVDDIKVQEKMELSNKMKKIVEAAHTVVEDRLVNGDVVINPKTGDFSRKPVNMRDAHRVAVDLQNQREMVEKATLGPVEQEENTDRLEQLATKFATFATMSIEKQLKKPQITIDVEDASIIRETSPENL